VEPEPQEAASFGGAGASRLCGSFSVDLGPDTDTDVQHGTHSIHIYCNLNRTEPGQIEKKQGAGAR
jgi:hypothetical protein